MPKILITFLGATEYSCTNYFYRDPSKGICTNFVQRAIIRHFASPGDPYDLVLVLLTKKSKEVNWEPAGKLKDILEEEKKLRRIREYREREIDPNKVFSGDPWEILRAIREEISEHVGEEEEIELHFDVTHSFRAIPILVLPIVEYLKEVLPISEMKILYGAYGFPSNELSQIVDLTHFNAILEWIFAYRTFKEYGRGELLAEVGLGTLDDIREVIGEEVGKIRKFLCTFSEITKAIIYCRTKEVEEKLIKKREIFQRINDAKEALQNIPPLETILENVEKEFLEIKDKAEKYNLPFALAEWCYKKRQFQAAITYLREAMITEVTKKLDPSKVYDDKFRESFVKGKIENLHHAELLKEIWDTIVGIRNDINHAGYRENPIRPKNFEEDLKEQIEKLKKAFKGGDFQRIFGGGT